MPREVALAILFADVSNSTHLYEALGDIRARDIVGRCLDTMAQVTTEHGGVVIKTIGDEVMCSFPTAQQAALAAIEMQDRLTGRSVAEGRTIAIRVGLHAGAALSANNDVFGDVVNVASRMVNSAKAGQILTTGATFAALDRAKQAACRQIDLTRIKGKQDEIAVYELLWRTEDATIFPVARHPPWAHRKHGSARLVLSTADQEREVSDAYPTLTIGRTEHNDLIVADARVSRQHAKLDYRAGRFILTDFSTNGTFIAPDSGAKTMVHRDSVELTNSGVLGLGEAVTSGVPNLVRYEVLG